MMYVDEIMEAIEALDIEKALELFDKHRTNHGNEPEFITAQAILCIQTQELKVACDLLLDGISKHPKNADLMYNLGYTYECMADVTQALKAYKRAIELTDDESFINELTELCTDIESSPEFLYTENENTDNTCVNTSIITLDELVSMNFDIDLSNLTPEKIKFLLRRVEFWIEAGKARIALSTAVSSGLISKEDLNNIIAMSWLDKSRLAELTDILNA